MFKTLVFVFAAAVVGANGLKCYTARLTIMQAGQSEELPLDAKLETNCTACQRLRVVTESGPMPVTILTWTCEQPHAIQMPVCPGQTTPPPSPKPQEQICVEMASRTKLVAAKTSTQMCSCCQDQCNKVAGCQLTMAELAGLKSEPVQQQQQSSTANQQTTLSQVSKSTTAATLTTTTWADDSLMTTSGDFDRRKIESRCDALRLAADIIADACMAQKTTVTQAAKMQGGQQTTTQQLKTTGNGNSFDENFEHGEDDEFEVEKAHHSTNNHDQSPSTQNSKQTTAKAQTTTFFNHHRH